MLKENFLHFQFFVMIAILLAACGSGAATQQSENASNSTISQPTPPAPYTKMKSPKMSSADSETGQQLYRINCATCHGENGMGDGPASAALDPQPKPLAATESSLSDAYLFWRISEGGQVEQFKSAMPAWKSILSEDKIWQIVSYLRKMGG